MPIQEESQKPSRKNAGLNATGTMKKSKKTKHLMDLNNYESSSQQQVYQAKPQATGKTDAEIIQDHIKKRKPNYPRGRFIANQVNEFEDRVLHIEHLNQGCMGGKNMNKRKSKIADSGSYSLKSLQQVEHEFFYSTIDKPYFRFNEFREMLAKVGLGDIAGRLTLGEWSMIRKAMGRPRRFSNEFVKNEVKKLETYRGIVREYLQNQSPITLRSKLRESLSNEIMKIHPYKIGQLVTCIHPVCKHFHTGSILTSNGDLFIVKFITNELGVQRIPDTNVTSVVKGPKEQPQPPQQAQGNSKHAAAGAFSGNKKQPDQQGASQSQATADGGSQDNRFSASKQQQQQQSQQQPANGSTNPNVSGSGGGVTTSATGDSSRMNSMLPFLQDLDFFSMAFLIKLLDRKTLLINELKDFNDQVEKRKEQDEEPFDQQFYQKYGWTGIQINLIDNALKHVIAKFRLRGIGHFDQQQIASNFNKILRVPLNYIQRELEQNPGDQTVLNEIKTISDKSGEEHIQQAASMMISKVEQKLIRERGEAYGRQLEENFYSSGYGNLLNIVYNCVGILETLKTQGDINITQNTFLNSLAASVYSENAEQFLEINDAIQDILQKHKEKQQQAIAAAANAAAAAAAANQAAAGTATNPTVTIASSAQPQIINVAAVPTTAAPSTSSVVAAPSPAEPQNKDTNNASTSIKSTNNSSGSNINNNNGESQQP